MSKKVTLSGNEPVSNDTVAPDGIDPLTGMHKDYWILSEEDRAKGFVRPVRLTYTHIGDNGCGKVTRMNRKIAETYAADPKFYGSTFCSYCGAHYRVGVNGEFVWEGTDIRVGE